MASKSYLRGLLLWFALLLVLMLLLSFTLVVRQWYLSSLFLMAMLILVVLQIFRLLQKTNRRLADYFRMMQAGDFSARLPEKKQGLGFDELHSQLNKLTDRLQQSEHSRKQEEGLFRAMIEELHIGVFLLDSGRALHTANPMALRFLNLRSAGDKQRLKERAPHFYKRIEELREKNKVWLELNNAGETQRWLIQRRTIKQAGQSFELFLVNNVQAEMESRESEVIQKLMHTLTHEIMNSISPITSLIGTLQLQVANFKNDDNHISLDRESYQDLQTTARIIDKRSSGLVEFVERYSLMARLPRLQIERIEAEKLIQELRILLGQELKKQDVGFQITAEARHITFRADKQLLLQVILNLVKNATEALQDHPEGQVRILFAKADGYNYITVSDNAGGVPADLRENIFLPFFSTKSKGSGIGLSLSRKIIDAHNGRLYLRNLKGGSEFRVELAD